MTSNHHAPYGLGYTRATMAGNKVKRDGDVKQSTKTQSQFGLQSATRLHEAGIASNRKQPLFLVASKRDGHSRETAVDNTEEGGDDVKSSCPLCLGLHTCYNGCNKVKRVSDEEQSTKKQSQFGLQSATRLHEVGIASNRESECRGEYVPGSCTHRPSHHGSYTMGVGSARSL